MTELSISRRPADSNNAAQLTFAHAREVRLILRAGLDLAGGPPEQAEWAPLAGVVPDACGHDAVAAHDASHLGQPRRPDPT